jgi:hypothetical protein
MVASLWVTRGDGQKYFSAALTVSIALITLLATGWSLLVTACLLWPGLGTADPDASLPAGFEGQRFQFELLVLAPLAAVVAACSFFYLASRRSGWSSASASSS